MSTSKKTSCMWAVGGALLVTSGFFAARKYNDFRRLRNDIGCIPWEVPTEYTSWKTFFKSPRKPKHNTTS